MELLGSGDGNPEPQLSTGGNITLLNRSRTLWLGAATAGYSDGTCVFGYSTVRTWGGVMQVRRVQLIDNSDAPMSYRTRLGCEN